MKLLVTGGAGFIGSNFVRQLINGAYQAFSGAEVIVLPAAFTMTTGKDHWEVLIRARAIENQCYLLAAGQQGKDALGRLQPEHVEDDLQRLHVRVPHRLERLPLGLDADAVVPHLPGGDQVVGFLASLLGLADLLREGLALGLGALDRGQQLASPGVEGDLAIVRAPVASSSRTTSVNGPPVSMPTRSDRAAGAAPVIRPTGLGAPPVVFTFSPTCTRMARPSPAAATAASTASS